MQPFGYPRRDFDRTITRGAFGAFGDPFVIGVLRDGFVDFHLTLFIIDVLFQIDCGDLSPSHSRCCGKEDGDFKACSLRLFKQRHQLLFRRYSHFLRFACREIDGKLEIGRGICDGTFEKRVGIVDGLRG